MTRQTRLAIIAQTLARRRLDQARTAAQVRKVWRLAREEAEALDEALAKA